MRKTSAQLSVFHDGQFFTAVFEVSDEKGYSVAKRVFAQKPADLTILEVVREQYYDLEFSTPSEGVSQKRISQNPKRRQRQAAKAAKTVSLSTKAQDAIRNQHEQNKADRKTKKHCKKEISEKEKFAAKKKRRRKSFGDTEKTNT